MTRSDSNTSTNIHGTLVQVHGIGLLLTGKSAVGKSEAALDLVTRNHKIICDDLVVIHKDDISGELIVRTNKQYPHHIAIRGIGLIDIAKTFGTKYTAPSSSLNVVVELVRGEPIANFECVGDDQLYRSILGSDVPFFRIPIQPGKNTSAVLETIALKLKSESASQIRVPDYQKATQTAGKALA